MDRTGVVTLRHQRWFYVFIQSGSRDLAHDVVEGQAENLDMEVDLAVGRQGRQVALVNQVWRGSPFLACSCR
jgi:hypothetical protein